MDAKSLNFTNHGLAMKILLLSLATVHVPQKRKAKMLSQNFVLIVPVATNLCMHGIHLSQSYTKTQLEATVHLQVKVEN